MHATPAMLPPGRRRTLDVRLPRWVERMPKLAGWGALVTLLAGVWQATGHLLLAPSGLSGVAHRAEAEARRAKSGACFNNLRRQAALLDRPAPHSLYAARSAKRGPIPAAAERAWRGSSAG